MLPEPACHTPLDLSPALLGSCPCQPCPSIPLHVTRNPGKYRRNQSSERPCDLPKPPSWLWWERWWKTARTQKWSRMKGQLSVQGRVNEEGVDVGPRGLRYGGQRDLGAGPCPAREVGLSSIWHVRAGRALKAQKCVKFTVFKQWTQLQSESPGTPDYTGPHGAAPEEASMGMDPLSPPPAMLQRAQQAGPCLSRKGGKLVPKGGSDMPEVLQAWPHSQVWGTLDCTTLPAL